MSTVKTGVVGAGYVGTASCPLAGEAVTGASIQVAAQAVLNDAAFLNAVLTDGLKTITCLDVMATTLHGNAGTVAGVFGTGATNGIGVKGQGAGTGDGVLGIGGATGDGITGNGGSTSGNGVYGIGGAVGAGVRGYGGSTSGAGVSGEGAAAGARGGDFLGGTSGDGCRGLGGATNGVGGRFTGGATAGFGVVCLGGSTNGTGGSFTGFGTGRGATFVAASASLAIEVGTGNMALNGSSPAVTADPGFNNYVSAAHVPKAWGNINLPLNVPALIDGVNVASVAPSGTNALTVTLVRPMANTTYAPVVSLAAGITGTNIVPLHSVTINSTTVFTVTFYSNSTTHANLTLINLAVFFTVMGRQ